MLVSLLLKSLIRVGKLTVIDATGKPQEWKKRHIAAKLLVRPSHKVLDIGCGWGGWRSFWRARPGAT